MASFINSENVPGFEKCASSAFPKGEGNTNLPLVNPVSNKVIREIESKNWCFTLNNYADDDLTTLRSYSLELSNCFIFSKEVGASGTPHLQGYFELKVKKRMSTIKKIGSPFDRMHLERRRGSKTEAISYCCKEAKRRDIYSYKIEPCMLRNDKPRDLNVLEEENLYPWQKDILDIIVERNNCDRSIYWIYENEGHVGKSAFTKFIAHNYGCMLTMKGKMNDIMNAAFEYKGELRTVICDIPRSSGNKISTAAIEQLKNGVIINHKFETGQKVIASPVIIIFSNFEPELEGLSLDRWKICEIVDKKLSIKKIEDIGEDYNKMEVDDLEDCVVCKGPCTKRSTKCVLKF